MCTWNSSKPYFRRCLSSIKREVDVHHFVVVDRYSSDDTLNVVRSIFPEAKILQTDANLAVARKIGITHVDTRYFAFIDDDVELSRGWFTKLLSFMKRRKKVGAVQGFPRYYLEYLDNAAKFQLNRRKEHVMEIEYRGKTHNTILITQIVRDFNPPAIIHSWEDFLLTQHVIKKGYKWFELDQVQVTHYMVACRSFLDALRKLHSREKWGGAGARLAQKPSSSLFRVVANIPLNFLKVVHWSLMTTRFTSDPRILIVNLSGRLGFLKGFLSPSKYRVPNELHASQV